MTEKKKDTTLPELAFQDLSPFTALFRTKLIEEFQLLDNITAATAVQAPQFTSRDVKGMDGHLK
jgi:cation channel sperm-associated protein 2